MTDERAGNSSDINHSDIAITLGTSALANTWFEPICGLYDAVFSVPPHNWQPNESAAHRARLRYFMGNPTFAITVAVTSGTLLGFCYGYCLPERTRWWRGYVEPLPEGLADEWEGRTFVVIDLAVAQAQRGQGYGRQLLETLLANRTEERATLAVQPQVAVNHTFYAHLGWKLVGRQRGMRGESSPFFDIYLLPLR